MSVDQEEYYIPSVDLLTAQVQSSEQNNDEVGGQCLSLVYSFHDFGLCKKKNNNDLTGNDGCFPLMF